LKYFTKEGMALGGYKLKHLTDHTSGARGYESEIRGIAKEIDAAGYGPKALRRTENVNTFPIMERYVSFARKQERMFKHDIKHGMDYDAARKKLENATSKVLMRHIDEGPKKGQGHQFVISVAREAKDIFAGNTKDPRRIRVVSPQPQGFPIHNIPEATKFTEDFEKFLTIGKGNKKYITAKKLVKIIGKIR